MGEGEAGEASEASKDESRRPILHEVDSFKSVGVNDIGFDIGPEGGEASEDSDESIDLEDLEVSQKDFAEDADQLGKLWCSFRVLVMILIASL